MNQSLATLRAALGEADRKRAEERIEEQKHRLKVEIYIENQQNEKALNWIGAISTEKEYDEAKRERTPGTCDWIFSKTEFTNWLCPKGGINTSSMLWTHGGAGMGKTFISARVIEYLHQFSRPTAFFFCTHSHPGKNQTMSIVRSWIFQLARQSPRALKIVRRFADKEAVTTILWEILQEVLKDIGSCYLVLDGLDECLEFDPTSRSRRSGEIKIFIEKLIDSIPSTGVKLLVISRDVVAIRSALEPLRSLNAPVATTVATTVAFEEYQIQSEDNKADIMSFAGSLSDSLGFRNKDKEAICNKLSERCGGMFLWARLGGERLHVGMGSKRLDTVLTEMPPGLNHAYERNLQTILKKEKYYQDQAIAIFRLVLFTLRPLSVEELLHALEINDYREDIDGTSGFEEKAIPDINIDVENKLTALLQTCGSLLEIRKTKSTSAGDWHLQFIHFSAKEYLLGLQIENCSDPRLLRFSFSLTEGHHATLTNTCLLYLVVAGINYRRQTCEQSTEAYLGLESDDEWKGHEQKWRFYSYARHNWGKHFRLCGNEVAPSYKMRRKIFLDNSPAFDSWKLSLTSSSSPIASANDYIVGPTVSSWSFRVLTCCMFGMLDILREHLMAEAREGIPQAALLAAVMGGHAAVAEMLVQRDDVDVNTRTFRPGPTAPQTVLYHANRLGLKDTVRLLLGRRDLRVNERFRGPELRGLVRGECSALLHAIYDKDKAFLRQLLRRDDLDVNGADRIPLNIAMRVGFLPGFELLLARKDINVNLSSAKDSGQTPLHHAVRSSPGEFLKLLLARDDIQVNKTNHRGETPLNLAVPGTGRFGSIRDKGGNVLTDP